ncbi:hypothetical protein D910_11481, partial [Dendroctonus ponderosae]
MLRPPYNSKYPQKVLIPPGTFTTDENTILDVPGEDEEVFVASKPRAELETREQENFEEDLLNFQTARRKLFYDVLTLQVTKYESLVVTDVRTRNGIFPKICKFEVKSFYKYGGVIAVIENLNLMTKYNSNECREYVQFRTKNGISSRRYCGLDESMITTVPLTEDVSPKIRLHPYLNAQEVANNSFIDVDGEMDVIIFLTEGGIEQYNKTLFRIVFTSYVDCALNANLSNMKDCTYNHSFCINSRYFRDGNINCPYFGCSDEFGCIKS